MNWFNNLKIGRKLALGFGLCLLLAAANVAVAVSQMARMSALSKSIVSDSVVGLIALTHFQAAAQQFRLDENRHLLSFSRADKDKAEQDLTAAQAQADEALNAYAATTVDVTGDRNIHRLEWEWQAYAGTKDQLLTLSRTNNVRAGAALLNGPLSGQFAQVTDTLDEIVAWNEAHGEAYSRQAQSTYTEARALMIGLLAAALALGALVGLFVTRFIQHNLALVSGRLDKLSGCA